MQNNDILPFYLKDFLTPSSTSDFVTCKKYYPGLGCNYTYTLVYLVLALHN